MFRHGDPGPVGGELHRSTVVSVPRQVNAVAFVDSLHGSAAGNVFLSHHRRRSDADPGQQFRGDLRSLLPRRPAWLGLRDFASRTGQTLHSPSVSVCFCLSILRSNRPTNARIISAKRVPSKATPTLPNPTATPTAGDQILCRRRQPRMACSSLNLEDGASPNESDSSDDALNHSR